MASSASAVALQLLPPAPSFRAASLRVLRRGGSAGQTDRCGSYLGLGNGTSVGGGGGGARVVGSGVRARRHVTGPEECQEEAEDGSRINGLEEEQLSLQI